MGLMLLRVVELARVWLEAGVLVSLVFGWHVERQEAQWREVGS